ncbi:hypothetical protein PMAYCL1PPCAC_20939, partial [Pristionchus mayeri]
VASSPCIKRFFPHLGANHFVCVCNSTYCDEYEEPRNHPGTAVIYSSSESADRMVMRTARVSKRRRNTGVQGRIELNTRVTYQEIIGFGGAFTDAAGINIASLSETTRERLMQTIFGRKGERIPLIHRALNLTGGDLRLFSSPWSAPAWMKSTGKMEGPGWLRRGMEGAWAKYFVRFFEEYLSHGVSFWATTVQNEPALGGIYLLRCNKRPRHENTHSNFVANHFGPSLAASNASKNVKIIALDDSRFWLPWWANVVYSDPVASSFISGVGIHWYFDAVAPVSKLTATHKAHPEKFILATEASSGWVPMFRGPVLGEWARAEEYARSIIEDLNTFVAGWTDWNMALNPKGGPTWAGNFLDSPIIVNATADEFLKQPTHYAMAHFSRFIRPGAKRVKSTTFGIDNKRVMHTAFVFKGKRIVAILNRLTYAQKITIDEPTRTSISLKLAPKSITTVVWKKR